MKAVNDPLEEDLEEDESEDEIQDEEESDEDDEGKAPADGSVAVDAGDAR